MRALAAIVMVATLERSPATSRSLSRDPMTSYKHRLRRKRAKSTARKKKEKTKAARKARR